MLKDVLTKVQLHVSKTKELNSYYFVLNGSDRYKFVLSNSEIFNGNNIYIITETNGKSWTEVEDRVAVLILTKSHKGHVAMKRLEK